MLDFSRLTVLEWVDALQHRTPVPAGGALALVTLAGAAGLAAKMFRLCDADGALGDGLARGFVEAAADDGELYVQARRGGAPEAERCLDEGLRHLDDAVRLLEALGSSFEGVPPALAADLTASARLVRAAAQTLLVNAAVNLGEWRARLDEPAVSRLRARLEGLKLALDAA